MNNSKNRYRLHVYRSNVHIYAQITKENEGKTLVSVSDISIKEKNKIKKAFVVGEELAKKAVRQKIIYVWFDRKQYRYHGRIKALAEGARKGGLKF